MLELNKIYNMDCLKGMKLIDDKSIDLTITSPPYNLGNNHHTGNKRHNPYNDNLPELEYQENQISVLNEIHRITKDTGSLLYNHKNRIKNGIQTTPYEWVLKTKWVIKQELVWFNGSQNFDKVRFYPMTERIYWLSKRADTKLYNAINHHDLFTKDKWFSVGTNKEHKRAFPVSMINSFIACFDNAETIFDPYMGSGTTAIGSINSDKNFIGFEICKEYFDKGNIRIEVEKSQLRLKI